MNGFACVCAEQFLILFQIYLSNFNFEVLSVQSEPLSKMIRLDVFQAGKIFLNEVLS